MGLKEFIETNPMIALLGVAITVGSTTAGVVTYFAGQKADVEKARIESEIKIEKGRLETEIKNEVLASKTEIATLKTKLASIERRVGPEGPSFFDVTKLIVTPDGIKTLDPSYKTMAGGTFFIAEPSTRKWQYSHTSELEIMKEMAGSDDKRFGQADNR